MPQKVFELDMVFKIYDNKPIESYHLAGICTNSVSNFNDIKSIVESVLSASGFSFSIKETSHKSFIEADVQL
jgi:Phenylalanyl-tRNA synthetase beta subunit